MADLRRIPLSAFDPRFRTLIERGCREAFEIPCRSRAEGLHLRHSLTVYRAKLKKEFPGDPTQWDSLYGTIISNRKGDDSIVTLRPRRSVFDEVLAGIEATPPALPADPLTEFLPEEEKPA